MIRGGFQKILKNLRADTGRKTRKTFYQLINQKPQGGLLGLVCLFKSKNFRSERDSNPRTHVHCNECKHLSQVIDQASGMNKVCQKVDHLDTFCGLEKNSSL